MKEMEVLQIRYLTAMKIDAFLEDNLKYYHLNDKLNFKNDKTDCFVFPDKLPKKSTRRLCVKITNKTSGPNRPLSVCPIIIINNILINQHYELFMLHQLKSL